MLDVRGTCWWLAVLLAACGARTGLDVVPCVPAPDGETCDGEDDDCDGLVDEDIEPVRCGENGCETVVSCVDGHMPACLPKVASTEICNLLDDDCDGEVDEGLGFGALDGPIVLRRDEFDTGGCTSCSWAWGSTLAPSGDGWLAVWNLGLYGGEEQPTLYGRRLDASGHPVEDVRLLRDDFILEIDPMQALSPLPPLGLPFDAELRMPDGGDVAGFLFVGGAGGETTIVMPTPAFGPYEVPRTVWTGDRFVSAWVQDDGLRVASLAADGGDVRNIEVDPLVRPGAITLGVYPGRVGILVSRYRDETEERDQWFIGLDARGDVVTPARQIDVEYVTWQRLVGTEDGWLHVRPNTGQGPSTRQMLAPDGEPTSDAIEFEDGRHLSETGSQDVFTLRPGSNHIVAAWQSPEDWAVHVELLDGTGGVLRTWSGAIPADPGYEEGYLIDPHVSFAGDHILLTWHGIAPDAQPNPVYVMELGCVD